MDTQITGGTIRYEDGVKANEDYAPAKKAAVELVFAVAEGADPTETIDKVAAMAQDKVYEMIGKKAPMHRNTEVSVVTGPQVAEQLAADEAKTRKTRTAKPKETQPDPAAIVDDTPAPHPSDIVDPAAIVDDVIYMGDESEPAATDPAAITDDWDAPAEITDADLTNATTKKNAEISEPTKIRDLIQEFNPDPSKPAFQLRQIPQPHRVEYLAKLALLKKA